MCGWARPSGGLLDISDLRRQRALEGWPRLAARDVVRQPLVALDDVGVIEDAQHGRHHQVASGEALAVEIGLVAERRGERAEALLSELHGARPALLGPCLVL